MKNDMGGFRVLRSSDWEHGDDDGGEGHLGTIAWLHDDNTVDVVWDNGRRTRCSIGKGGTYELLIFDNAPVGVRHTEVTCDGCDERGIYGMRWKCVTCPNYNLCPVCYVGGKHELTHEFLRFTTSGSEGVKVRTRLTCQLIQATGLFPGAIVERGPDWKWDDQDGGVGSRGKVVSVESSSGESAARNVVRVRWDKGGSHVYRVGANGKLDIKYVEEFPGTYYYRDHLPRVRKSNVENVVENVMETETEILKDDDKVYIKLSADVLREKQKEASIWTNNMADCIGKTGVIKGFTPTGDAMVEFEGLRFRLYPGALQKVRALAVGEIVRMSSDEEMVSVMQKENSVRSQNLSQVLGKCGRVVKIDADGDVAIAFGEKMYVVNPACCAPAPGKSVDDLSSTSTTSSNSSSSSNASPTSSNEGLPKDVHDQLRRMLADLLVKKDATADTGKTKDLLRAIVQGDLDVVRTITRRHPDLVNARYKDSTPLIIASREGEKEIVRFLLENKAETEATDDKGNTALCYALNGKKEAVAMVLIEKGAKANVANFNGRTPLHFAAWNDLSDVIKPLIEHGCPVNAQDKSGDTALHDAIERGHRRCVDVICRAGKLDFTVGNKKGFTPLQLAALRDNSYAVERILQRDASLANAKKAFDNYAPLHIAASNDHVKCARLLIEKGNAVVDVKDDDGVTPLHLGCHEAYYDIVELLIDKGATVDIQDDEGNTPLHLAMAIKRRGADKKLNELIGHGLPDDSETRVRIACLLIENGAFLQTYNNQGMQPLEVANNDKIRRGVQLYIDSHGSSGTASATSRQSSGLDSFLSAVHFPCMKCTETMSDITTKPCGHKMLCRECCLKVDRCPLCEQYIERRIAGSSDEDTDEQIDKECKVQ